MSAVTTPDVVYEDSDGEPMSDNTLQFRWIVTLQGGLDALFRNEPNVFVAGDLLWYPVEGQPKVRAAPDAMVVFGRPKGDRGSYKQWAEGGVAPQVVFEVLSPSNRPAEMAAKKDFYERHGVEEYYVYDPEGVTLAGYLRDREGRFDELPVMDGHVSPRLGVRFELRDELVVSRPDGKTFATYLELVEQNEAQQVEAARERRDAAEAYARLVAEADARRAEAERERRDAAEAYARLVAEADARRAEAERERQAAATAHAELARQADARRAEAERERQAAATAHAELARQADARRAEAERERQAAATATAALEVLQAKLRAAGIDPDAL